MRLIRPAGPVMSNEEVRVGESGEIGDVWVPKSPVWHVGAIKERPPSFCGRTRAFVLLSLGRWPTCA